MRLYLPFFRTAINRFFATRKWHIFNMSLPFELFFIADEKLSAPNFAIRSKSRPVKGHTDQISFKIVLPHTGRNMCMMVLDTYSGNIF